MTSKPWRCQGAEPRTPDSFPAQPDCLLVLYRCTLWYTNVPLYRSVRSTGFINPTFRTWIAYGHFTNKIAPRPTYPTYPNFSRSAAREQIWWLKCPCAKIRSKLGAGLESSLIEPVARTAGVPAHSRRLPLPGLTLVVSSLPTSTEAAAAVRLWGCPLNPVSGTPECLKTLMWLVERVIY